jgi:hypothetical protein
MAAEPRLADRVDLDLKPGTLGTGVQDQRSDTVAYVYGYRAARRHRPGSMRVLPGGASSRMARLMRVAVRVVVRVVVRLRVVPEVLLHDLDAIPYGVAGGVLKPSWGWDKYGNVLRYLAPISAS